MIYTEYTKKAISLMFEAHKDQKDKNGMPYVFHSFHVAEQMDSEDSVVVALLHDLIEDTHYTLDDLRQFGFNDDICNALELLTHSDEVDYFEYVKKIKTNPLATKVKIADLRHNSDLSRLDVIENIDLLRKEKYAKALEILLDK